MNSENIKNNTPVEAVNEAAEIVGVSFREAGKIY